MDTAAEPHVGVNCLIYLAMPCPRVAIYFAWPVQLLTKVGTVAREIFAVKKFLPMSLTDEN